jgi:hypothetical protein
MTCDDVIYRRPPPHFRSTGLEGPEQTPMPEVFPAPPPDPDLGEHAAWMRSKRDRPEILQAIIAVRGHNNPDDHRYTAAADILKNVSAWLEERGYKPVSVDALARKIPRT